jgi:hypothetical protein
MVIVALLGTDGIAYQMYQDLNNGTWGWYGPLTPVGLQFTSMAMERSSNGNGQLFLTGTDGRLYLVFFDASLGGPPVWYGQLPSPSGCPSHCLVSLAAGQGSGLQVVGIEQDNGAPSAEVWSDYLAGSTWLPHPAINSGYTFNKIATVVCSDCAGWPSLYAIGLRPTSGALDPPTLGLPCVARQLVNGTGDWERFVCQDNPDGIKFQAMATGRGNNDNPQLIMIGANPNCSNCDGKPYLYFQQNSTGAWPLAWHGPLPNPDSMKFHFVTTGNGNNGGNMQVIALAGPWAGLPYLIYQGRGDGSWHWYGPLPDPIGMQFTTASAAQGNNNNLQVVLLGTDGRPYLIFQTNSDGVWHWYGLLQPS